MNGRAARANTAQKIEVRLEPVVADALRQAADRLGFEHADYAAGLMNKALLLDVGKVCPGHASRLRAERKLKLMVAALARRLSQPERFDAHVTLQVFRAIRIADDLRRTYLRAAGGRSVHEIGNPVKARINRALAANIQAAIGAEPLLDKGRPVQASVRGEFVFSYTVLASKVKGSARKNRASL